MKNNRPRKHHYLPQSYLRGFSDNGTHLNQIEKRTGRSFGASIGDTAAIRDFHNLDFDGCPDPYALEKFVSQVEALIAPALDKVAADQKFTPHTRGAMNCLVSMLMARVPATRDMVEESVRESVRSVGMLLEKNGGLPPRPPELEQTLSLEDLEISVSNWYVLQHMYALAFDQDMLDVIGRCQAELIEHMLDAVCAVVALLSAQFIAEDFSNSDVLLSVGGGRDGMESAIGGYFRVSFPEWPEDLRYEFDWHTLENTADPFSNFPYE